MPFSFHQKVLFKHCDPAGIVFYPRYFEMINDCVEAFFDTELDHPFETLHRNGGVPTAEISTRFTAPSRHGDRLELRLECREIGRSSLKLTITALCGDETRFVAQSVLVHVGADGRAEHWPVALRNKIEHFLKEDN